MQDSFGRTVDYMRVSLTDRCNLRCWYCTGRGEVSHFDDEELLRFDEYERILRLSVERAGIRKIRLTGGEPLLYERLEELIVVLRSLPQLNELTMTTNGLLLAEKAEMLHRAGVDRVNVSLEGANDEAYRQITGKACLKQVLAGLEALLVVGYVKPKLNVVLCRGIECEELGQLLELGRRYASELRFIELMGHADRRSPTVDDIIAKFDRIVTLRRLPGAGTAVCRYLAEEYDVVLGMIPSRSRPFCAGCSRIRLTSDGHVRGCLFEGGGTPLRRMLREGCSDEELVDTIRGSIMAKPRRAVGTALRMSQVGG